MNHTLLRMACVLLVLPLGADAASPGRSEYQAALRAIPDPEHGAELFVLCASCHGTEGQGLPDGSTPRIAGQHYRVIVKQLVDFRYGKRWDFRMEQRANAHLGAFQDIADVANYLSQLPRNGKTQESRGDDYAQGGNLYAVNCASCHGTQGEGDDEGAVPMLAGQHPAYLLRQMYDSVDGRRPGLAQLHSKRIKPLDFEQLRAIAGFLSKINPADAAIRASSPNQAVRNLRVQCRLVVAGGWSQADAAGSVGSRGGDRRHGNRRARTARTETGRNRLNRA